MELKSGEPLSGSFAHITHCLDALRQEIICNVDDTPRWSGYGHRFTGAGQYRMCRDWKQLDNWAMRYPACWGETDNENPEERLSFCPKDSSYAENIIEKLESANHLGE